ncbi:MAG: asparagine synthase (glutamine-hydrolyzing), partial [Pseudomonadota bacterium]
QTSDGRLVVTYNGEIYNYPELRRELESLGHVFRTHHSDTEVLLHGYRQWGEDLPVRLNGMWAFAIYDQSSDRLFLSRDRFGKKPIYYTRQNGTFAFASELTALLKHSRVTASVSQLGLKKYFAYGFIPSPQTIFTGIHKLPGGHNLVVDMKLHEYRERAYWEFVLEPEESPQDENVLNEQLHELLKQAVERRLISDVPLGVFLSGGLDSSAVAALAGRALGGRRLKTFSIGFTDPSFDESEYARMAAASVNSEHHEEVFSMEQAKSLLPEIATRLDEPMGDSSILPTFLLCRSAGRHVKAALGGDGGDELFAGYDPFLALRFADLYDRFTPRPVHKAIRLVMSRWPASHGYMAWSFRIKRTLRGLSYPWAIRNPVWLGPLEPSELDELFMEPVDVEEVYSEAISVWEKGTATSPVDRTLQFYTRLYLCDDILVKIDRAGMMNSLEVRAPFLDIDLINFVRRLPKEYKIRGRVTKYLLRKTVAQMVPEAIIHRPKKGFAPPIGRWLAEERWPWPENVKETFFHPGYLKARLEEHRRGYDDHRGFLWNAWLLSMMGLKQRAGSHAPVTGQL